MRRFGIIGLLVTLLIAGVAGVIGYNLGVGSGLATTTDGATRVVYAPWGWGFGGFGLIFGILFFVLIFGLIRRAAWGGRGYGGGYGPKGWGHHGGWDSTNVPPVADRMLQDWHRRAHGEPPIPDAPAPGAPSGPDRPADTSRL